MSQSKNSIRSFDKIRTDIQSSSKNAMDGELNIINTESCTYAVTVSKKPSPQGDLTQSQQSFISIHSTDQLFQVPPARDSPSLDDCNVEVLSLNEVFPSTSEESVSNDDDAPVSRKKNDFSKSNPNKPKSKPQRNLKSSSFTASELKRQKDLMDPVKSSMELPKSTLTVIGSNPGEPKMAYADPPKKVSKTMKKFLRNIEKHKNDHGAKGGEKVVSKLTTMRGILKMQPCGPECTGDSVQDSEDFNPENFDFAMAFGPKSNTTKQNPDKNVTFNTQVVIIHFSGDLCLGQSVESLSKEKDQQARNSELRKTFLSKYNEFWPTQK